MDNLAPNQNEQESPTLDEKDLFPIQADDRSADNPMGTVLNFLGLSLMADIAVDTFETVGGMGGGLTLPGIMDEMAPTMGAELNANMENAMDNAMDIGQPMAPTFTA
ncbi:MAG: hypothetical protein ACRBCK_08780 [Alphaproteobacteria bacterium]